MDKTDRWKMNTQTTSHACHHVGSIDTAVWMNWVEGCVGQDDHDGGEDGSARDHPNTASGSAGPAGCAQATSPVAASTSMRTCECVTVSETNDVHPTGDEFLYNWRESC